MYNAANTSSFWAAKRFGCPPQTTVTYRFCSDILVKEHYLNELHESIGQRKDNSWDKVTIPEKYGAILIQNFSDVLSRRTDGNEYEQIKINNGYSTVNKTINYDIKIESTHKKNMRGESQPQVTYRIVIHLHNGKENGISSEDELFKAIVDESSKMRLETEKQKLEILEKQHEGPSIFKQ